MTGRTRLGRSWTTIACAFAIAVAATLALGVASAGASGPTDPAADAFYRYTGPLTSIAPGTVLRTRTVTVAWAGLPTPISATQILYRTSDQLGQPTVTVTTVLEPAPAAPGVPTRILSYQVFYDGLGSTCDPSYNLRVASLENLSQVEAGNTQSGNDTQVEEGFMTPYLAAGNTLVVPDYEGENFAWGAGQVSAYQTLDGIRAAESFLKVSRRHTPVAMLGYSGGSIPTQWADEIAPAYAPELDLVGAAAGGVPVDLGDELPYLNGSPSWAGVMPGVLVGISRGMHVDLMSYLSPYGQKLAQTVSSECANSFESSYPGLTIQQLFGPAYQNPLANPTFASVVNQLIMGSDGTPKAPLFLGVGNADGTGDGVIMAAEVEGLAQRYCRRGASVQFDEYQHADHLEAGGPFEAHAFALIQAWLAGVAAPSGCSSVSGGSSLTPLTAGTAPPAPPAGAISSGDVTSVDPAGTGRAFDGNATLTINGAGAATVSQFAAGHDPVATVLPHSDGHFLALAVSPGSNLSGASVSICGVRRAPQLDWWDAAAMAWKPVSPAAAIGSNPVAGGPSPCLTANLSDASSPAVGELGSVVLGLSSGPRSSR